MQLGMRLQAGLIALTVFLVDQASKPLVLSVFETGPHRIEVTSFFNLVLVYNYGVSFGMFANDSPYGPYILSAVAVLVAFAVWKFILTEGSSRITIMCVGLIVGGAFGNILDRLLYGAVVDFLDFHFYGYHWPAFNVADCGIVVGAVILAVEGLFSPTKPHT